MRFLWWYISRDYSCFAPYAIPISYVFMSNFKEISNSTILVARNILQKFCVHLYRGISPNCRSLRVVLQQCSWKLRLQGVLNYNRWVWLGWYRIAQMNEMGCSAHQSISRRQQMIVSHMNNDSRIYFRSKQQNFGTRIKAVRVMYTSRSRGLDLVSLNSWNF